MAPGGVRPVWRRSHPGRGPVRIIVTGDSQIQEISEDFEAQRAWTDVLIGFWGSIVGPRGPDGRPLRGVHLLSRATFGVGRSKGERLA